MVSDELAVDIHDRSKAVLRLAHSENGVSPPAQCPKHLRVQLGQRTSASSDDDFRLLVNALRAGTHTSAAHLHQQMPMQVPIIGRAGSGWQGPFGRIARIFRAEVVTDGYL